MRCNYNIWIAKQQKLFPCCVIQYNTYITEVVLYIITFSLNFLHFYLWIRFNVLLCIDNACQAAKAEQSWLVRRLHSNIEVTQRLSASLRSLVYELKNNVKFLHWHVGLVWSKKLKITPSKNFPEIKWHRSRGNQSKTLRVVYNKRRRARAFVTLPYGTKEAHQQS